MVDVIELKIDPDSLKSVVSGLSFLIVHSRERPDQLEIFLAYHALKLLLVKRVVELL